MEIIGHSDCFSGERVVSTVKKLLVRFCIILFLGLAIFAMLALAPVKDPDPGGERIQKDVVRFHVVAKSDQPADQELKLLVRDAVLDCLRPSLEGVQDQRAAAIVIQEKLPQIEEVAAKTLQSKGCRDLVRVDYGIFDFPVRVYGPLTFPEGRYQSLRIVLGEGEGRNWWCCLFPPLCFVDLTGSAQQLEEENKPISDSGLGKAPASLSDDKNRRVERGDQLEKLLLLDDASEVSEKPRLTTKIGEWLDGSRDRSLLSRIWSWRG